MLKYIVIYFISEANRMAKDKTPKTPKEPKPPKAPKEKKEIEKNEKKKSPEAVNPILKLDKQTKVELQNFLFGTSEKKLMVSEEFLNKMIVKYISKRMKIINTAYSNLHTTRSAIFFSKNAQEIEKHIEDLIVLEKYYPFKNPVPSIYKRNYLAHKPAAITGMINRVWKTALQKYPLKNDAVPEDIDPAALDYYDQVINELLSQKDCYSESDMELINSFYNRVHGEQTEESIDPMESSDENEAVEDNEDVQDVFKLDLDGE